jgi:hypothetical protein
MRPGYTIVKQFPTRCWVRLLGQTPYGEALDNAAGEPGGGFRVEMLCIRAERCAEDVEELRI